MPCGVWSSGAAASRRCAASNQGHAFVFEEEDEEEEGLKEEDAFGDTDRRYWGSGGAGRGGDTCEVVARHPYREAKLGAPIREDIRHLTMTLRELTPAPPRDGWLQNLGSNAPCPWPRAMDAEEEDGGGRGGGLRAGCLRAEEEDGGCRRKEEAEEGN